MKTSHEWARFALERIQQGGLLTLDQQANVLAFVINAAVLEAGVELMPRWTPATEPPPAADENVLVLSTGNDVGVGYYEAGEWHVLGGEFTFADNVDYWMPKPPTPDSEAQQ